MGSKKKKSKVESVIALTSGLEPAMERGPLSKAAAMAAKVMGAANRLAGAGVMSWRHLGQVRSRPRLKQVSRHCAWHGAQMVAC